MSNSKVDSCLQLLSLDGDYLSKGGWHSRGLTLNEWLLIKGSCIYMGGSHSTLKDGWYLTENAGVAEIIAVCLDYNNPTKVCSSLFKCIVENKYHCAIRTYNTICLSAYLLWWYTHCIHGN